MVNLNILDSQGISTSTESPVITATDGSDTTTKVTGLDFDKMEDGYEFIFDNNVYKFNKTADGSRGNSFKDLDTLKKVLGKNGLAIGPTTGNAVGAYTVRRVTQIEKIKRI